MLFFWISSPRRSALRQHNWPIRRFADLAAMAQIMIGDDACHHGFADRHGADADTRIVAPLSRYFGLAAVAVDGAPRRQDRRGRLDRETRDHRLAGRYAAED